MDALTSVVLLALVATVVALGTGIVSMARGGEYDRQHSEQFMISRVVFQGIALVALLLALYLL